MLVQEDAPPVTVQLNVPEGATTELLPVTTAVKMISWPTVGDVGDAITLIVGTVAPTFRVNVLEVAAM